MSATSSRSVRTARSSWYVETTTFANTTAPTNSPSRNSPTTNSATIMNSSSTLKNVIAFDRTTSQLLRCRVVSTFPSPASSRRAASASLSPTPGPSPPTTAALVITL